MIPLLNLKILAIKRYFISAVNMIVNYHTTFELAVESNHPPCNKARAEPSSCLLCMILKHRLLQKTPTCC